LLIGLGVFPAEQPRPQDFEAARAGLRFLFAAHGLRERAADAVCIVVKLFQRINRARLGLSGKRGKQGSGE